MDDIVVSVMYIYIIVNYMCIIIILQIDVHIVVGESMCIYIYTYTYIVSGKGLRPLHDLRLMIGLARKFSHNYMCFRLANHCTSAHNCMIYCMLIFTFISLLHSYIYTVYTLPLLRSRKKNKFGVGFGNWSSCQRDGALICWSIWMHVSNDHNMQSSAIRKKKMIWWVEANPIPRSY